MAGLLKKQQVPEAQQLDLLPIAVSMVDPAPCAAAVGTTAACALTRLRLLFVVEVFEIGLTFESTSRGLWGRGDSHSTQRAARSLSDGRCTCGGGCQPGPAAEAQDTDTLTRGSCAG
jgi:hypothetical protein